MTDQNDQHAPSPPVPGRLAALLDELITEIGDARAVPLSNNVMINQEDMLDRLHEAAEELPEELRAARWMVRERESYIARTNDRAQELVNKAKTESQELISENYIVQEAVEEANSLIRNAENEGRRIRLEAEDYAERHLAEAENVLGELYRYVTEARAELHTALPAAPEPPVSQ
jgi:vacuolar-type H+-ATPase subunit H